MTESVVVDPDLMAAMPSYPPAEPGTQRYFECEDGGISYTIVARDMDHAKAIMQESGAEAYDEDTGNSVPWSTATWLEWRELGPEAVARIRVCHDDHRGTAPDGKGWPLDTYRPGEWCCSEW